MEVEGNLGGLRERRGDMKEFGGGKGGGWWVVWVKEGKRWEDLDVEMSRGEGEGRVRKV